ncbi:hypothetical protein AB0O76_07285 [Streptomyces sp. NPDC086554]|uniref:hypothetical protein n=1 Tax=Streptomyces sp. NPDC086554 TaxID=3154864 RepID=UPI00341A16D3
MTSTRRIVAAVALAAGASALAAPTANAATAPIAPIGTIDGLAKTGIPEERRDKIPTIAGQLGRLSEQTAPVTGVVPAVQ